jgi:hypothetical protein
LSCAIVRGYEPWPLRSITTTDALNLAPGLPFAAGTNPIYATVDPCGSFLYVVNANSGSGSAFSVNPAMGTLTLVSGVPSPEGQSHYQSQGLKDRLVDLAKREHRSLNQQIEFLLEKALSGEVKESLFGRASEQSWFRVLLPRVRNKRRDVGNSAVSVE